MNAISSNDLIKFIQATHPYAGKWERKVTTDWLQFFLSNKLISVVTDDGVTIDGMLLFRTVNSPEIGRDESEIHYDPKGMTVWLDYCYATSRRALKGLTICAALRLGKRDLVAWQRTLTADRGLPTDQQRNRMEVVTVTDFFKHFLGEIKYGTT